LTQRKKKEKTEEISMEYVRIQKENDFTCRKELKKCKYAKKSAEYN
jgi:hypothetical protein